MRVLTASAAVIALLAALVACPQAKQPGVNSAVSSPRSEVVDTQLGLVTTPPTGATATTLKTADGYNVAAWYWAPTGKQAPGIILVHQRGRDKSSWGSLPALLTKEGYAVIAVDLRGHGQTTGLDKRRVPLENLTDADYKGMLKDVAAADKFLRQQKNVDGDRIGIIGASIGANLAIMYLAQDRRIRTAVCLSPGLDYKGLKPLDYMKAVDKRPLYLLAGKGDEYSANSAAELSHAGDAKGPKSLRLFEGSDHGTDLLRSQDGLDRTIASGWLLNYLPPKR
jgi:dienelactone hydrolase